MDDSNLNYLKCPYCSELLIRDMETETLLSELTDEQQDRIKCPFCENVIIVSLIIYKEYEYSVEQIPEEEQIAINQKKNVKNNIPGRIFMFDLNSSL